MLFKVLQVQAKSTATFLCLFLFSATFLIGQSCNTTLAHWDLESCSPDMSYDEFTAQTNFPANMTGSASIFSNMGSHSCAPGAAGVGICHSIHDDCTWEDNNPNAYRFSVNVAPAADYKVTISGMNFFEAAPLNYTWLNGASGDNDPPSKYGIRVLKDGVEIFQQIEIATSPTWSLEEFDFSGNMEFMTDRAATYSFELLGYCRQTNSPVGFAIWDVDEIMVLGCAELIDPCSPFGGDADGDGVCQDDDCDDNDPNVSNPGDACDDGNPNTTNDMMNANCVCAGTPVTPPCNSVDGGTLTGGPFNFCVDGIADNIPANGISLTGSAGPINGWIVTDNLGEILGLPPTFTAPNFDAAGIGTCLVYYISYETGLTGLAAGANINNLQGCFDLSNGIEVVRRDCSNLDCPNLNANVGDSCNDGNPNTTNDVVQANCICTGTPINTGVDCPNFNANIGDSCNDGNPNTTNDVITASCTCVGTPIGNPPVTSGCDAIVSVNGNTVTVVGANDALNSVKVIDMNGGILFEVNSWTGNFPAMVTYTFPADGKYFVHVETYTTGFATKVCDIFETIIIGTPPPPAGTCSITASASNVTCDGTGTFSFDVTATSVNGGAWGFDVLGTNSMMNINGSTITISGVPVGSGATLSYTVIDHDKPSCTTTISVTPPSTPCQLVPPTDVCEAQVRINGNEVNVTGLTNVFVGVKVIDSDFGTIYQCDTWDGNCNGTSVDVTLDQPGTYYVSVVTYDAEWNTLCRLFEKVVINDRDGLTNSDTGVNVFPIPAENNVNLRMNGFDQQDIDVMILSQFGQVIKTFQFNAVQDHSNIQLSLEGLTNGVYSIVILSEKNQPISKKLVVGKSYNNAFIGH